MQLRHYLVRTNLKFRRQAATLAASSYFHTMTTNATDTKLDIT
jgi:hypothetical protein